MSGTKQIELAALEERIRITGSKIAKMQLQVDGWLAELPAAKAAAEEEARSFVLVEKPKKVISPEQLAKMKAGLAASREAKKLAKMAAETPGAAAGGAAVVEENATVVNPELLTNLKAKKAAKKAAKKSEAAGGSDDVVEKPKKVLTPEHLAKLKAGREAKAAAKKAKEAEDAIAAIAGELIYPPV